MSYGTFTDSFEAVTSKLGNRQSRKIGNNTYLVRRDDDKIAMRLHATDVLTFTPDYVELNTGGWYSVTTKDRLNYATGARLYSDRGTWYVGGNRERRIPFFDGIRLSYSGDVLNPLPVSATDKIKAQNNETKKAVAKYVAGAMQALSEGMPNPSGGDCWYCSMVTQDGIPLGDVHANHEHLHEHIAESYYVPSLLFNAVKEAGYVVPAVILGMTESGMGAHAFTDGVKRALRKYLLSRLLVSETGVKPASKTRVRSGW